MLAPLKRTWSCHAGKTDGEIRVTPKELGHENSAQSFSDRSFWKSLRVVEVRAFGSWMSAPTCLFFQDFDRLTEVLGRDIRANDPRMSAGRPPPKLPLWADFSFLSCDPGGLLENTFRAFGPK